MTHTHTHTHTDTEMETETDPKPAYTQGILVNKTHSSQFSSSSVHFSVCLDFHLIGNPIITSHEETIRSLSSRKDPTPIGWVGGWSAREWCSIIDLDKAVPTLVILSLRNH